MLDIISIGDATIDTVMTIHDASVQCNLAKQECKLQLNYADKIIVESMNHLVAGNAANNAVGSSRLGLKTALCSIVGDDENGERIIKTMKAEKVKTNFMSTQKNEETNASTVINFQGERTILAYHAPRKYVLPRLPASRWIYYTSVGEKHKRYNREIIAYVRKTGAKMGFNPGSHQLKADFKILKPVIAHTYALFVNKEEAQKIIGEKAEIKNLLVALAKLGPKIVVITDGGNGSYVQNENIQYHMGIMNGPVVERTGAGDSYATGFLSALHYQQSIEDAMLWGAANATSVIAFVGPQAGLLTKDQMREKTYRARLRAEIM